MRGEKVSSRDRRAFRENVQALAASIVMPAAADLWFTLLDPGAFEQPQRGAFK